MNRFSCLLLIAAWALFSCEEPETVSYPITYGKTDVTTGPFRAFTSQGEITQTSVIKKLMRQDTGYFNYLATFLNDPNRVDRIRLKSSHEATLTVFGSTSECTVVSTAGTHVLKSNDTTSWASYAEPMTRTLAYLLAGVKPELLSEYLTSSTGGNYVFGYTTRETFLLNGYGVVYSMPILTYAASGLNQPGIRQGYINNTLQPDFYKQLSATDTVAVMDYLIWFKKQSR